MLNKVLFLLQMRLRVSKRVGGIPIPDPTSCDKYRLYYNAFKGMYLSKALTCMKCFLYKQNLLFIKEKDTFGHIVV